MSKIEDIIKSLREEIDAAYKRGFAAGGEAMRDRILQAAQARPPQPVGSLASMYGPAPEAPRAARPDLSDAIMRRAPRGAVGRLLERILSEMPGLTITEIEAIAPDYDNSVAIKSIGNELRRFDGDKYRRDDGYKWFLIRQQAETETAGAPTKEQPAVISEPERG